MCPPKYVWLAIFWSCIKLCSGLLERHRFLQHVRFTLWQRVMLFQPLDKESDEFKRLTEYVANTHASTHNQYELHVVEVSRTLCHMNRKELRLVTSVEGFTTCIVLNSHFQYVVCCFTFSYSLQFYYLSCSIISNLIVTDIYSQIVVLLYNIYSYDVYCNVAI